ncbi:MAG: isoprenylcysteine carboxylmethyltransferase family protein, partial [Thermoanaerobaculia bacterium]|nr:isoprenylcysteine carboxylmethyltransferase family protein [Thermoanaerobaculia bacterium]
MPEQGESRAARRWRHLRDSLRQGVGVALAVLLSVLGEPAELGSVTGAVLVVAGVSIRLWASGHIRKNRSLATGGPYARVRHPLYLGNLMVTVGFCLASGLWWSWPVMLVFWLVFYPNAIGEEDRKLERL